MRYKVGDLVVPKPEHYDYFRLVNLWGIGDGPLEIIKINDKTYNFKDGRVVGAFFYRVELYKGSLTKEQQIIDKINYLYSISKCPLEKKWITKHD